MINWQVSEQTADFILKVLAQRPYSEVNQLIQDLVKQANDKSQPELPVFPD